MQAGDPAQPVQQSVVIARIRGRFLRAALPSPSDIGQCFSTMFEHTLRLSKSFASRRATFKSPASKSLNN